MNDKLDDFFENAPEGFYLKKVYIGNGEPILQYEAGLRLGRKDTMVTIRKDKLMACIGFRDKLLAE